MLLVAAHPGHHGSLCLQIDSAHHGVEFVLIAAKIITPPSRPSTSSCHCSPSICRRRRSPPVITWSIFWSSSITSAVITQLQGSADRSCSSSLPCCCSPSNNSIDVWGRSSELPICICCAGQPSSYVGEVAFADCRQCLVGPHGPVWFVRMGCCSCLQLLLSAFFFYKFL
jgi:hypothetical protein